MQNYSDLKNQIETTDIIDEQPCMNYQSFISFHIHFKFRIIQKYEPKRKKYITRGNLIYNSGQNVYINPIHQKMIYSFLNTQTKIKIRKIVYSIDPNIQTLSFSSKFYNKLDVKETRDSLQKQLLLNKQNIITLLCVLGHSISSENAISKKLMFQKRKLKQDLENILSHKQRNQPIIQHILNKQNIPYMQQSVQKAIIYYGQNTNYTLQSKKEDIEYREKEILGLGGYFRIEDSDFKIVDMRTKKVRKQDLVVKCLKEQRILDKNLQSNMKKINRQIEILNLIEDKRYLINYYVKSGEEALRQIFMDKFSYSLDQYLYYTDYSLDIKHKIIIAKQIVHSVILLHASQVIHRDVKPANFLIQDKIINQKINIKIIDFAQSFSPKMIMKQGVFACSHPYSPFECTQKRKIINGEAQEGLSRKQIDYWSVGITIYQLFFEKLPLSYSKIYLLDIVYSWRSELQILMNKRDKIGFNLIQSIIQIMCFRMMRIKQNERLNLYTALEILNMLQKYVQRLYQILQ